MLGFRVLGLIGFTDLSRAVKAMLSRHTCFQAVCVLPQVPLCGGWFRNSVTVENFSSGDRFRFQNSQ